MKSKKFVVIVGLFVLASSLWAEVKLEFPVKGCFYYHDVMTDRDNKVYQTATFKPFVGPVRCQYLFEQIGLWTFGIGGSLVVYPMQIISVSSSATVQLADFQKKGILDLVNNIDLGFYMQFHGFYNTADGKRTLKGDYSPFFEYSIKLVYRNPYINDWYLGLGYEFDLAKPGYDLYMTHSVVFTFGYRFQTKKDLAKRQSLELPMP